MMWTKKLVVGALAAAAMSLFGAGDAWAKACTSSNDCGTGTGVDPNKPICDAPIPLGGGCLAGVLACTGQCRACNSGLECTARNPGTTICAGQDGGPRAGQCIGCTAAPGQCQGPTPVCDVGSATCVGCLGNGDCQGGGGNPVCDQSNHQCISCQNDFEPNNPGLFSCSNPDLPACQTEAASGQQGACTQCRVASGTATANPGVCPGNANTPVCSSRAGSTGGACGCNGDADCGSKNGRICDGTQNTGNGACVNGCRSTADCPTGKTCENIVGGVGICKGQTCNPANGDADCKTAPNLHCDGTLNGGECVECLSDNQCTGGKVCETDTNNPNRGHCVECTKLKDNNCKPTTKGDECIGTTDTCGCITDGDCGDAKSGRVCDDKSTHTCIEGCRGKDGNGCSDDKSCSSTNHDIGKCNPKSGGDGGADGGTGNGDGGNGNGDGGNGNGNGLVSLDNLVEGGGCSCTTTGGGANPLFGMGIGLGLAVAALSRRLRRSKK
jgi:MYXO-CTERM domain-containing protein